MREKENGISKYNDDFIMSPKNDFVFKLLFGDYKNKDSLIALLSAVLSLPEEEFEDIKILNNELIREFKEDKKGILNIRVGTRSGNQIDIEIQILPIDYMPSRKVYYWNKMYTGQAKSGDTYRVLKKCITINILNFECIPLEKLHTVYYIIEKYTGHIMTELLEIHFLELPKLASATSDQKSCNKELLEWLKFINSKSKGEMEMLAKKKQKIKAWRRVKSKAR